MRTSLTAVRVEGSVLPADLLDRVGAGDAALGGLSSKDYHLPANETPRQAANRAWSYLKEAWEQASIPLRALAADDPGTRLTREQWSLVLLRELGFGRVPTTAAGGIVAGDKGYAVSHLWEHVPIHLLGWNVSLDRRTKGVPGAAERAPHAMVQELLNRTDDHLWAVLSNGRRLRLLRDSTTITGQAFVEFDLESMFDNDLLPDFVVLYLLCHESRFHVESEGATPVDAWLERWRGVANETGVRVRGELRTGVKAALERLGTGFLRHPANAELRDRLGDGRMTDKELHRELLRLVYRLLFLFVTEDRNLLHATPDADLTEADRVARQRYRDFYSTDKLRRQARTTTRGTRHTDAWQRLWTVLHRLDREGLPELDLPALRGLFAAAPGEFLTVSRPVEVGVDDRPTAWNVLSNEDLLPAIRSLSVTQSKGQGLRRVDFAHLGAEELGSIYESLLELVPRLDLEAREFTLVDLAGNDRKTSGSYYTPSSLIDLVLDEALDPLLDEVERAADPEAALLATTVCDPACGSGHFLVAAARRIADRLATIRGRLSDSDPTPADHRQALRDVVIHTIHGVDINPMAAELAKVSLWLESADRGMPLAFLDHHIKVGNSLIGTTPALLSRGIPDEAYAALTGDDKPVAKEWLKRNRQERSGQDMLLGFGDELASLPNRAEFIRLSAVAQRTEQEVESAERRYADLTDDTDYRRAVAQADLWCAAFFQDKIEGAPGITTSTVRSATTPSKDLPPAGTPERVAADLAADVGFFHWHVEFPEVFEAKPADQIRDDDPTGWIGGFAAMLGNPPWERVKLQEKEFFAQRDESIANAKNAAARKKAISQLSAANPALLAEWQAAGHESEATSQFLRRSGRFPLTGVGDVNTYSVFAELFRSSVAYDGCMGIITPTGLATDATTAPFFADAVRAGRLGAFYDFENEAKIFPGVHNQFRFGVTSMTGGRPAGRVRMAFYTRFVEDVPTRRFELGADEVALINPNTKTLPIFRARRDAEITLGIFRRFPVLVDEATGNNPWGLAFMRMLDMANDSHLFRSESDLRDRGVTFDGWSWRHGDDAWFPLYEAKMLSHFDHRYSTYANATEAQLNKGTLPRLTDAQHDDPAGEPLARYWVAEGDVIEAIRDRWDRDWLLGWRDITNASNERTFVPSVLPLAGVGNKFPLVVIKEAKNCPVFQAMTSAHVFDYVARQKLSGTGMTYFIVKQLACPTPTHFDQPLVGVSDMAYGDWVRPLVLELTYTSWRIAAYANDCMGLDPDADPGPPFRWIPERREQLRAELDAAMFHLYGLGRDEVEHVMDSFTVVRKYDERDHGEFRTKRLILEVYDAMADAAARGATWQSPLDPPAGHGPRHAARAVV